LLSRRILSSDLAHCGLSTIDLWAGVKESRLIPILIKDQPSATFELGCTAFVMVVHAADLGDFKDLAEIQRLDRPWFRSISLER
jgi:hypothetical protein